MIKKYQVAEKDLPPAQRVMTHTREIIFVFSFVAPETSFKETWIQQKGLDLLPLSYVNRSVQPTPVFLQGESEYIILISVIKYF